MWLGEQITERGIGNGISMIILAGIVAGVPGAIAGTAQLVRNGEMSPAVAIMMMAVGIAAIIFVVYMERAQRRITVNYARRQQGPAHVPGAEHAPAVQDQHVGCYPADLRVEHPDVPGDDSELLRPGDRSRTRCRVRCRPLAPTCRPGQPIYVLLYAALIIFFCFFYTALMFNSKDTADNLKRSGAFVPGIRPGAHTAEYIDKVLTRLTFWGAIYIAGVCLLPEFARMFYPTMPFSFGGTSLLILVVVTMDFMSQMQAHAMSHQYEGMMQKANLRNYGRGGQLR